MPFTESYSPDPAKGSKTMKDFKRLSTLTKKIPKGSHKVKVFLLDGRSIDLDAEVSKDYTFSSLPHTMSNIT